MGLLSWIELPHWLMMAGIILITTGVFGLVITRHKHTAPHPDTEPPTLPSETSSLSQADSSPRKDGE
jgi:hypothetical protein